MMHGSAITFGAMLCGGEVATASDNEGGSEKEGRRKGGGREEGGRKAVKEATLSFLFSSMLWITGRQMHLFPL